MTDEKLALLEQVTYIDKNLLEAAGITEKTGMTLLPMDKGDTVGEVLQVFGKEEIEKLRNMGDTIIDGAVASGKEWASVIENLQNDPEIANLEVTNCQTLTNTLGDSVNLNVCYKDPQTNQGIITYKGTSGFDEWYDNFQGIGMQDNQGQMDALRFYNESTKDFDDVVVAGHSKGANKAMYVTVTAPDDKISKCTAFDGQGFSDQFLEHYAPEIEKNAGKITNYAVDKDFVHGLMNQVPGAEMKFVEGHGMTDARQYHSPNSFFVADENGQLQMQNGQPQFNLTEENEQIKHINGFVKYVMDNCDQGELKSMGNYLGKAAGAFLGEGNGAKAVTSLLSDPKKLGEVKDLLAGYAKENNLGQKDFDAFVETFAVNDEQLAKVKKVCGILHTGENIVEAGKKVVEAIKEPGIPGTVPDIVGKAKEVIENYDEKKVDEFADKIDKGSEKVADKVDNVADKVGDVVKTVGGAVFGAKGVAAGEAIDKGGDVVSGFIKKGGDIVSGGIKAVNKVASGVKKAVESVGDFVGGLIHGKTPATKSESFAEEQKSQELPPYVIDENPANDEKQGIEKMQEHVKEIGDAIKAGGKVVGDAIDNTTKAVEKTVGAVKDVAKTGSEVVNKALKEIHDIFPKTTNIPPVYPIGMDPSKLIGTLPEKKIIIINPSININITNQKNITNEKNINGDIHYEKNINKDIHYEKNINQMGQNNIQMEEFGELGDVIKQIGAIAGSLAGAVQMEGKIANMIDSKFDSSYTPLENPNDIGNQYGKELIKPAQAQDMTAARRISAHC